MTSLNKVLLIGRVVSVEWVGGVATLLVTTSRLASNPTDVLTVTHSVVCRGSMADRVEAYNLSGAHAFIEGFLETGGTIAAVRLDKL
jgi:single-stranded DNA-binding protein